MKKVKLVELNKIVYDAEIFLKYRKPIRWPCGLSEFLGGKPSRILKVAYSKTAKRTLILKHECINDLQKVVSIVFIKHKLFRLVEMFLKYCLSIVLSCIMSVDLLLSLRERV